MKWKEITDHHQAFGKLGRWTIKVWRDGSCRLHLNGGIKKDEVPTLAAAKKLAESIEKKHAKKA